MRFYRAVLLCVFGLGPAYGQETSMSSFLLDKKVVYDAAVAQFSDMPKLVEVGRLDGVCGSDEGSNDEVIYCTTQNTIFLRMDSAVPPYEFYELAHVLGHAVQVQHGVADVAFREITRRRDEEDKLRGWVTRQVECIAGFLFHAAGLPQTDLRALYDTEPMTDSHWGRDPLSVGPKVSIGLDARAEWFSIGQMGDLSACAVGEFGSELLTEALRNE